MFDRIESMNGCKLQPGVRYGYFTSSRKRPATRGTGISDSHSLKADKDMQADLARLDKACSDPERFVTFEGASDAY